MTSRDWAASGAADPQRDRIASLISSAIRSLKLDLRGRVVVTEAATGPYCTTPIIAAMAGSPRVIALTRESRHGSIDEVLRQTGEMARHCGVASQIEVRVDRREEWFQEADVVTNLGFVRPIDAVTSGWMRPGSVVPLMCEAWEWRSADLDLRACRDRGIQVFGTNEDHPKVLVFDYCGWLALKLLLEAGLEGHKTRVLVVGPDNFARVIVARLAAAGAVVSHILTLQEDGARPANGEFDAVIIADYHREGFVIGPGGAMESPAFVSRFGPVTVIPFVGQVDVAGLQALGVRVFPPENVGSQRMVRTLAALGPRPVIDLHAAGLKVGALALSGETAAAGEFEGLAQPLQVPSRPPVGPPVQP